MNRPKNADREYMENQIANGFRVVAIDGNEYGRNDKLPTQAELDKALEPKPDPTLRRSSLLPAAETYAGRPLSAFDGMNDEDLLKAAGGDKELAKKIRSAQKAAAK